MPSGPLAFLITFVLGMILTPIVRMACLKFSLHANPNPIIATHKKAIPTLGGIAVYLSLFLTLALFSFSFKNPSLSQNHFLCLLLGSLPLFLMGIYDDLRGLSVKFKFVSETILTILFILVFDLKPDFGIHPVFEYLLMLLWFTGIINAFNLIDIMDGLASGIGLFASLAFYAMAFYEGHEDLMILTAGLSGCYIAFLYYNFNPAKIFLGDNGSLIMGLALAYTGFELVNGKHFSLPFTAPAIALLIPIFEVFLLIIRRKMKHIPVLKGSPDHLGLVVQAMGNTIPKSAFLIYVCAIILSLLSIIVWRVENPAIIILIVLIVLTASVLTLIYMRKVKTS
jgi:UDP-GlcNAc:undecaprenyl-phosphate GlcNAc-1-phosphate transferase